MPIIDTTYSSNSNTVLIKYATHGRIYEVAMLVSEFNHTIEFSIFDERRMHCCILGSTKNKVLKLDGLSDEEISKRIDNMLKSIFNELNEQASASRHRLLDLTIKAIQLYKGSN
jgi:hypothetical protein